MPPHHRGQMGVLVADGLMPVYATPSRNRCQRAGVPVLCRYLPHHILTQPRLTPNVGEAKEGERGTMRLRMVSPIRSVVAEIDEARLVGMEGESYRAKRLPKTPRTRLASKKPSNASTASSAKRIRVHLPLRRERTSNSNHLSSTWCRKMFERQGECRLRALAALLRARAAANPRSCRR